LIYWFGRLVKGAGGFGKAMRLLKDVAIEVWERIKLGGKSLGAALSSVWARIKAGWLAIGNAAIMAGSAYYEMAATAEEARNAADGLVTSSREMAQAATAPLTSMQALRDAMTSSAEGWRERPCGHDDRCRGPVPSGYRCGWGSTRGGRSGKDCMENGGGFAQGLRHQGCQCRQGDRRCSGRSLCGQKGD